MVNRNIFPYYLLALILITSVYISSGLDAGIKKRVGKDGTIEYYSENDVPAGPFKKRNFKSPHNKLIEKISVENGVDPYLIKCIIKVESNFDADAVSVAGAMGLMQIMQVVARIYEVKDPLSPEENLNAGIKHFKTLLNYFNNNIPLSLAAYHAGIGRVKKNMQIPPIKSTIAYVKRIMYLYTGKKDNFEKKIKKLYKRIDKEGMIEIYSR